MKSICLLLFLGLSALIQAQNPVPIPVTNISKLSGNWYVVAVYNEGYNNTNNTFVDCISWNVQASSSPGTLLETVWPIDGQAQSLEFTFTPTSNKAIWDFSDGTDVAWIGVDPVAYSWGLIGEVGTQTAFILSKSKNLSSAIFAAQTAVLKQEAYHINSTNYYKMPMNNC